MHRARYAETTPSGLRSDVSSIGRSILEGGDSVPLSTNSTVQHSGSAQRDEISTLPFTICALQSKWNTFLHFNPGAFCRNGTLIGLGATFAVEKHNLKDKHGSLLANPFGTAAQPWNPSFVAIKKVRHAAPDPARTLQSLERELIALRCVSGNKNVLRLIGVGWEPSPIHGDSRLWPVLVMELAEHGSLADVQRKAGALSYGTKRKFCLDVAHGLDAIHSAGLIHGDVKSENVLILLDAKEGHIAKISDLGFSSTITRVACDRTYSPLLSDQEKIVVTGATELWAPPEFREPGTRQDLMSRDIYSWGWLVLRVLLDGVFSVADIKSEGQDISATPNQLSNLNSSGRSSSAFQADAQNNKVNLHRHPVRQQATGMQACIDWSDGSRASLQNLKNSQKSLFLHVVTRALKQRGENDVVEEIETIQQVLSECIDINPARRSLHKSMSAWG